MSAAISETAWRLQDIRVSEQGMPEQDSIKASVAVRATTEAAAQEMVRRRVRDCFRNAAPFEGARIIAADGRVVARWTCWDALAERGSPY